MDQFKNIHEGERVFLIATGPSLNDVPFDKLEDEYTMALGSIHLLYDDIDWRPDYFVSWDFACEEYMDFARGHEQRIEYVEANAEENVTQFLSKPAKQYIGDRSDIHYYDWSRPSDEKVDEFFRSGDINQYFSDDIREVVYNFGGTITVLPQIAHYMGFDEMYFLGCDLYKDQRPYMLFKSANDPYEYVVSDSTLRNVMELVSDGSTPIKSLINGLGYKIHTSIPRKYLADNNHFSDDYTPGRHKNAERDNRAASRVHRRIRAASEYYDFDIYNATIGGRLEVYERVDLLDLLSNN